MNRADPNRRTLVLAHRGAGVPLPDEGAGAISDEGAGPRENTMAAFFEAQRLGADGVELDVRRTSDGALVVHHDADVRGIGPIATCEASALPLYIPLLAEVLARCSAMVVNVEIKSDGSGELPRAVAELICELGAGGRVIVSSFDPACLDVVHEVEPTVPAAWLLGPTAEPASLLGSALDRGYEGVHPFVGRVDGRLVEAAHGAGLAVRAWTVNAAEDIAEMVELGLDAVITDRVREAVALVRSAGTGGGDGGGDGAGNGAGDGGGDGGGDGAGNGARNGAGGVG